MDCNVPGFLVHHYLPEIAQTHVHWFGDAIQPSHSLLPSSPPAHNLSQHQVLSQWVGFSHHVAKVLELQLQHQSFQWIFRVDFLQDWLIWSPCCPRDSQESAPASQFESISSSALNLLYVFTFFSSICYEVMGSDAMIFVLWLLSFEPAFSILLFHFHQEAEEVPQELHWNLSKRCKNYSIYANQSVWYTTLTK